MRVRTDGKFFAIGDERFVFRGITYGTFERRDDGELFPDRQQVKRDFAAMREAGFSVVRTYTLPPDDVVDLAADWDLRLLAGAYYPDWRYVLGRSRRDVRRVAHEARAAVRGAARRYAGVDTVLALSVGNEIPADVVRWVGTDRVAQLIDELVDVVKEEDADALVTYANYPTAEYLSLPTLDFLTFNVFLERQADLRRYLTRLHHLAGDRPLVLGEIGLDAASSSVGAEGEQHQAEVLDWQLATAVERGVAGTCVFSWTDDWSVGGHRVEGWNFGLTRADRSPRPALDVAARWNSRTVADLQHAWPSVSVVVCAYNAESTLDECLEHTCALEYPRLEVIVVDDGSIDETATIAGRYPVRLVSIQHAGLSVARNAGLAAATGDLVAYLDSDAYPSPEWPYFLALGMDAATVGGVGGPNVPPRDDPSGAHRVARAPGGPVHVLVTDDRAEHVPGCNMAFWRPVLQEVGGFDPIYTAAGDDVDLCWKVLDRSWEIAFHPAALVWHHRRPGTRAYLRQQRGYGRAEALVEVRHPDRFTPVGTARWRGIIYDSFVPRRGGARIYRGIYGAASYQSVYRDRGHTLDLAHQVGVPVAAVAMPFGLLGLVSPGLAVPTVIALAFVAMLFGIDVVRSAPPRGVDDKLRYRFGVALLHLLQPLVRTWGRMRHAPAARRQLPPPADFPRPARRGRRGVLLFAETGLRADLAAGLVGAIRRGGVRALPSTGWDDYDAELLGSALVVGRLVTSSHPEGCVQVAVFRSPRWRRIAEAALLLAVLVFVSVPLAIVFGALVAIETGRGWWRTGPLVRRLLNGAEAAA